MSPNGNPMYELRHLPTVAEEIQELASIATDRGLKEIFLSALTAAIERLQTEPSGWGDPEYNLHKPGATKYHGILEPVILHYIVFEHEKVVLLIDVRPLPNSGLD